MKHHSLAKMCVETVFCKCVIVLKTLSLALELVVYFLTAMILHFKDNFNVGWMAQQSRVDGQKENIRLHVGSNCLCHSRWWWFDSIFMNKWHNFNKFIKINNLTQQGATATVCRINELNHLAMSVIDRHNCGGHCTTGDVTRWYTATTIQISQNKVSNLSDRHWGICIINLISPTQNSIYLFSLQHSLCNPLVYIINPLEGINSIALFLFDLWMEIKGGFVFGKRALNSRKLWPASCCEMLGGSGAAG